MKYRTAFFMAWGNFLAVPCPCKLWDNELRRLQLIFLPIIGLMMGVFWYAIYLVMVKLGLAIQLQAAVLTIYPFCISGFIHLDGFMDCNDAILSRRNLAERQRILKDSHVGAFAVISLVTLFLLFYSAMWVALEGGGIINGTHDLWALILIPLVSRACSSQAVLGNRPIGHSQYVQTYSKNDNKKYIRILTCMLIVTIWIPIFWQTYLNLSGNEYGAAYRNTNIAVILSIIVAIIGSSLASSYARKQLGGMSGDISGYALTISELGGLLTLAIL